MHIDLLASGLRATQKRVVPQDRLSSENHHVRLALQRVQLHPDLFSDRFRHDFRSVAGTLSTDEAAILRAQTAATGSGKTPAATSADSEILMLVEAIANGDASANADCGFTTAGPCTASVDAGLRTAFRAQAAATARDGASAASGTASTIADAEGAGAARAVERTAASADMGWRGGAALSGTGAGRGATLRTQASAAADCGMPGAGNGAAAMVG